MSSYLRRAGQRRFFQRIILALFYMGPAFTSFRQSLLTEKALPVHPMLRIKLLPRMRYPRNENIDVLAAYYREKFILYRRNLGRRW